jgi:hypothetical protein
MTIPSFSIDKYPVTNKLYKQYIDHSGYRPTDTHNFLQRWTAVPGAGTQPLGYERAPLEADLQKPVTHVSLKEARAYCAHYGKRLPNEQEWQYAAQAGGDEPLGYTGLYPWGVSNSSKPAEGYYYPFKQHGRVNPGPVEVGSFPPQGDTPLGVADVVGNVWQYTSEFNDLHTHAVVLRGSANYRPNGSMWYFPAALELDAHSRYFLMSDSYERAGTVGFRCVNPEQGHAAKNRSTFAGLAGELQHPKGHVDFSANASTLDWVHFGVNDTQAAGYGKPTADHDRLHSCVECGIASAEAAHGRRQQSNCVRNPSCSLDDGSNPLSSFR